MQFTPEQRDRKIESYGKAHQFLIEALPRFPREMWQFRPAPSEWSIHEIVVHIADSEAASFFRCRRFWPSRAAPSRATMKRFGRAH